MFKLHKLEAEKISNGVKKILILSILLAAFMFLGEAIAKEKLGRA